MSAPKTIDNVAKALTAWGDPLPDWVEALAEACNGDTQAGVGKRIGYAGSTVSQVLSNSYRGGDMIRFEAVVRGALMSETVRCPVLSTEIGRNVCQEWQRRPFSTASANAVRMYQGCRSGCPHSRVLKQSDREGGGA